MGMMTYMYDPAGRFEPSDEAVRAAHLVTVQLHWRLLHGTAGLMPKDTKHKPKCRRCRKIIRDVYFWFVDEHTYCRACGDKQIAPHCLCGCKRADCPVCQATGGPRKLSKKRSTKSPEKPGKKAPAPEAALALPDLKERLVELLERRRSRFEQQRSQKTVNPLSGKPGYVPPDPYPKGVTEKDLRAFRSRTGIELPDDVKRWLRITNGSPGFFGIGWAQKGANMEELWQARPSLRSTGWIPVGGDDFGNYYVRVVPESGQGGGVFYVEATIPEKLVYAAASDTLHFALFYLKRLEAFLSRKTSGWPQDKSIVLSQDPELARVEGAPFYWDAHDSPKLFGKK